MSAFDLSKKVAVVTGGNGGIGLGMAEALVEAGCAVHIWGRNAGKNEQALSRLRALGGRAEAAVCDVSEPKSVESAMGKALDAFGRVDGCFANAGSAAAADGPFSSARWRSGASCSRSTSTAPSSLFRRRRATWWAAASRATPAAA
jgi:NAD(P)-dependent dehydrogenase (short-subunit alcohol dehydrogenase family)